MREDRSPALRPQSSARTSSGGQAGRAEYRRTARRASRPGRRLPATILGMLLLLALVLGVLLNSPLLEGTAVVVNGRQNLTREQVLAAAGLRLGVNILRVSPRAAAAALAHIPRVARAEVRRVWPRGLEVVLVERTGLALLPCGSGWLEVAGDGVALELYGSIEGAGLPVLEGIDPALIGVGETVPGLEARSALTALAALADRDEVPLRAVLAATGLEIELQDATWLYLGPANSGMEARIGVALAILEELRVRGQRAAYIDVRLPGQPVIRPR